MTPGSTSIEQALKSQHQEARTYEKNESQGDLGNHEALEQPLRAALPGDRARASERDTG